MLLAVALQNCLKLLAMQMGILANVHRLQILRSGSRCMQVIRSLDELVTDIEDTGASMTDQHPYGSNSIVADGTDRAVLGRSEQQQQQHLRSSMPDAVADVSRQLSEKFDLHDSFVGVMSV